MKIEHDNPLFKTTVWGETSSEFTNYGIEIENGNMSLKYVTKFVRKNYKSDIWRSEEIYHSSVHSIMPKDLIVPEIVWESAKFYFRGYAVSTI